jgi:hypothetical protein
MKKILINGLNKNQCVRDFWRKQELKVVPSHYALAHALEDMGFEVDQRPVVIGEDLSQYDEVITYIHSPKAFCQFLWSGLWAVYARQDAIFAFDDWQTDQIMYSIKSYHDYFVAGDLDKAFKDYYFDLWQGKESKEEVAKYAAQYKEACELILERKNRLLISAFAGGDLSLLKLNWKGEVFTFNPNPYHFNRTPENNYGVEKVATFDDFFGVDEEDAGKKREWNFASLVQKKTRKWVESQGVKSWPITYYGSKRNEEKCERLTEDQMCKKFNAQWGVLMPGYFHSGSGWWRARPLQVADAGSILVGDKRELMVYYKDAALIQSASTIESLTDSQLTKLAQWQREAIYSVHPLDKAVTRSELTAALDAPR